MTTSLNLHPDALADLRASGLSDDTIRAAGLFTPAPGDLPRLLSPRLAHHVRHILVFPYPGAGPFYRAKLFPPQPDGHGHTMRYYQPAGTAPRLYLPPRVQAALTTPSVAIHLTEGEKKALRADQEGLACIGLGGLWSWRHDGRAIGDLDRVDWYGRDAILVPDSDVWTRADLLQPVYALGQELASRGARVEVLKLPAGATGAKMGLDDYLCAHCIEQLAGEPRLALKHSLFSRAAAWWKDWVKRKEAAPVERAPGVLELLTRAQSVRVLHPAQDVVDGVLWYGLPVERELILLNSSRQAYRAAELPDGIALRHTDPGLSTVSRGAAVGWLDGSATGSMATAIDRLTAYFLRYVVLPERRTALWVAAWTLATWCYRAFPVFPYLSIRSAEKRCGKSRMLGLLQRVGFNCSPVTAHPTEAQLYRAAARTGGVQLFDEVETLKGDKDRFDALITVLNVGFERGGVVTRLEKRGDRFVQEAYEVYVPRVLTGLAGLKDTLEDRALSLVMLRRRLTEDVARLGRAIEAEAQALRDDCALACLAHMSDIATTYELALTTLEREAIDDRAVDLWSPLLAVAFAADAQDNGNRGQAILDTAKEQAIAREADAEGGRTVGLVEALLSIREERGEVLTPADLLAALRSRPAWDWVKYPRRLAALLAPLGIVRHQRRDGTGRRWVYVLNKAQLADLLARYGAAEPSTPAVSGDTR